MACDSPIPVREPRCRNQRFARYVPTTYRIARTVIAALSFAGPVAAAADRWVGSFGASVLHDDSFTFVGEGSIGVPERLRGAGEIGWNIDEDATCKQQPRGSNDAGS